MTSVAAATTGPPTRSWANGIAFAALAVPLLILSQLLADPAAYAQMLLLVSAGTWLVLPYGALALVAWRGSSRTAGWSALGFGLPVLLAMSAALAVGGERTLGIVIYLAPAVGLTLMLSVACQLGLVLGGVALLRAFDRGGGPFALVMASALAVGTLATLGNTARYFGSPERRAAVARHQAMDAHGALMAMQRCLRVHERKHGAYPTSLGALDSDGCASEVRLDGFALDYVAGADGRGFTLRALASDSSRAVESRSTDESGTMYGIALSGLAEPLPPLVREIILEIDLCLEQYRLAHPMRGYPASLAVPDAEGFACFRGSGLGERMRSVVTLGESEGYRYRYTSALPDEEGRIGSFRLDVRPVAYGRAFRESFLCTPEGGLHVTAEDRPAETSDPDAQRDAVTGAVQRPYCMGPDVPARR